MTRNQSNDGMMRAFPLRHVGRTALKVGVLGLGGAPLGDLYERVPESQAQATLEECLQPRHPSFRYGTTLWTWAVGA